MIYIYTLSGIVLILALGYIPLRRKGITLTKKLEFANEFSNLIIDYLKSNGEKSDLINNAIMISEKMQNEMGEFGLISYKMPFADRMIPNFPVILNLVPIIKTEMHDRILGGDALNQNVQILQNIMLRYIGHLNVLGESANADLRNPMSWFREGIGNLISSPVWAMGYFNIISEKSLLDMKSSKIYKIVSGILALGGVMVALMELIKVIIK